MRARLVGKAASGAPDRVLVVAGDADRSYLFHKLEREGGIVGDPMPPAPLEDDRLELVRDWIDGGALE